MLDISYDTVTPVRSDTTNHLRDPLYPGRDKIGTAPRTSSV